MSKIEIRVIEVKLAILFFGIVVFMLGASSVYGEINIIALPHPETYFPDKPGNEWVYKGRISEGTVNLISEKTFKNVSKVIGTTKIDGVIVTVFHDTNSGNQGMTESYYLRDAAGIRYYGSKPGTKLEKQLVPYQIIRFPLELQSSFRQLNRTNLDLGLDLDHDGQAEKVDVESVVSVVAQETVIVPLGTYRDAIRVKAKMNLRVHLSSNATFVKGFDVMTVWFVKGVGLVKYVERQMIPMMGAGKDLLVEITEELEEVKLGGRTSLPRF